LISKGKVGSSLGQGSVASGAVEATDAADVVTRTVEVEVATGVVSALEVTRMTTGEDPQEVRRSIKEISPHSETACETRVVIDQV
jgi:hypothetical protein